MSNLVTVGIFRGEKGDPGIGGNVPQHNVDQSSHPDIRALINNKASPYTHIQSTMSNTWVINHNLGKFPSIDTFLSDGTKVEGNRVNNGLNSSSITFAIAVSGSAYCI